MATGKHVLGRGPCQTTVVVLALIPGKVFFTPLLSVGDPVEAPWVVRLIFLRFELALRGNRLKHRETIPLTLYKVKFLLHVLKSGVSISLSTFM